MLPFDFYPVKEINTKNNPNSSSFIFHRLPRGMGVTVGNSLKRILHDYISGVAPIGVKIADRSGPVKVELSKLEGVKETTPFLVLNLKEIIIEEKNLKEEIFCLELKVENKDKNKEVIITAADFQKDKNIEIKNPNLPLATLAVATDDKENPKLEIKLYCRKG
jgi:DNA-directed RNA polymerase subunit alpha